MKTLKLTRPVLEASLSKYSAIQKLNFVLPIFDSIFPDSTNADDLNQIVIFTAQYASYRLSSPINPLLSTYLAPPAEADGKGSQQQGTDLQSPPSSAHHHINTSAHPFIIEPVFYRIPLLIISHAIITRKMIMEALPTLSTFEKLNLILAIYDNICLDASDFKNLKKIMSGYVRYRRKK